MRFDIITIFPEMFAALKYGIIDRATKQGLITINYINPRTYSKSRYGNIDDRSYGGGPGMVMMVEPLQKAIHEAKKNSKPKSQPKSKEKQKETNAGNAHVVHLSPQGKLLDQSGIQHLSTYQHLIMIAGRYEGIDERLIELEVDSEWSIGDYVLSGGELAAMVMIDAITRTIPGALGDDESALQDSFTSGLLDYPHYTRPETFAEKSVPQALLSGNHKEIRRWRLKQSLGRTWLRRPNLLQKYKLTKDEITLLNEFILDLSRGN